METFSAALLQWYDKNKRELPWRDRQNAYYTWISEIMLQQTRVETVKPYFERFIREIPDIDALADCPEEKLLSLWEGLGYYSRARNLKKAAGQMQERFGSRLPEEYEDLLSLAGIGEYTAGAVASIAYGKPRAAVDGNVLRVWARLFEYRENIRQQEAKTAAARKMRELMPEDRPGDFNQALMELGALICLPGERAACEGCPVKSFCLACSHSTVDVLPFRSSPKERRVEERTVFVIQDGDRTAIRKRPSKGLLAGLYELPNTEGFCTPEQAEEYVRELGLFPLQVSPLPEARHIFSHIEWRMTGYRVRVASVEDGGTGELLFLYNDERQGKYAIPSAFREYEKLMKERSR